MRASTTDHGPRTTGRPTDRQSRESVFTATLDYFFSPIGEHLRDDEVTEIMVNGYDEVYVERHGQLFETASRFPSEDALRSAIHNVAQYVGREIDEDRPILDARLPDGSRVHAVIPPSARLGTYLTIRKFQRDIFTLKDFVRLDSLSPQAEEFLGLCVKLRKNIVIAGGTGTGKTTFLNALSTAIPAVERIVVIEDNSELKLAQPHTLYLESQQADTYGRGGVNIRQLFTASLRMRPDRIIVGEVRGGEALDMVQSMISGHTGSLTTVHATSPRDAMVRLETLSLMSDVELPVYVARAQAASAINIVVQLTRYLEDGSRRVTRITEQEGLDAENHYRFRDLFVAQLKGRRDDGRLNVDLAPTGAQPSFAHEPYEQGMQDRIKRTAELWDPAPAPGGRRR